jgi:hypothetical protein
MSRGGAISILCLNLFKMPRKRFSAVLEGKDCLRAVIAKFTAIVLDFLSSQSLSSPWYGPGCRGGVLRGHGIAYESADAGFDRWVRERIKGLHDFELNEVVEEGIGAEILVGA